MVGKKIFDKEKAQVWIGLRPVSPDGNFHLFSTFKFQTSKINILSFY